MAIRKQHAERGCGVHPSASDALTSISKFFSVHPETRTIVFRRTQVGKGSRSDLHCYAEVVAFHSPRELFDSHGLGERSRVQRDHRSHR